MIVSHKILAIIVLCFLVLSLLGNILESTYMTSNQMTIFKLMEGEDTDNDGVGDGISFTSPSFYGDIIWLFRDALTWNYSFLQNEYTIFRFVGFALLSLPFLFTVMMFMLSLGASLVKRLFGVA